METAIFDSFKGEFILWLAVVVLPLLIMIRKWLIDRDMRLKAAVEDKHKMQNRISELERIVKYDVLPKLENIDRHIRQRNGAEKNVADRLDEVLDLMKGGKK